MTTSRFEKNIFDQPALARAALTAKIPSWMTPPPKSARVCFVGIGTNHHAAQLAAWLWSSIGYRARAVHSHDFVSRPRPIAREELGVFLSHRGGPSFTRRAEELARRAGARTVVVSAAGNPWKHPRRLETGPLEDTGAFTHSLTSTLAWLLRWPNKKILLAPFASYDSHLRFGPAFPRLRYGDDLVFIGDGPREWIAREAALKCQETAYVRARAFGLEEFLHGPQISVGAGSVVVGFSLPQAERWGAARAYLRSLHLPWTEIAARDWLAQLTWAQRFALATCRTLGIDPDLLREDDPRYRRAKPLLKIGLPKS